MRRIIAGLAALAFLAGACGGGDDGDSAEGGFQTLGEFVRTHSDGLDDRSDEEIVDLADGVCATLGDGMDVDTLIARLVIEGMDSDTVAALVAGAVGRFCPQHRADE